MTKTPVFGWPRRGLYRLDTGSLLANASRGKMFALIGAATRSMSISHSALLGSILRNLARNALDHTLPGGRTLFCGR
jgi:signal transduction histidine kinase